MAIIIVAAVALSLLLLFEQDYSQRRRNPADIEAPLKRETRRYPVPPVQKEQGENEAAAKIKAENERLAQIHRSMKDIEKRLMHISVEYESGNFEKCVHIAEDGLSRITMLPSEQQKRLNYARVALIEYRKHALGTISQQKNDEHINDKVTAIERHFQKGAFELCIEVAAAAQKHIQSLPAGQRRRYAQDEKKIDHFRLKAETTVQIKIQQDAAWKKIQYAVAANDLEDAASLIDAMLLRPDLTSEFRENLLYQRKQIVE